MRNSILGPSLPRSSIAPAKIMAVAVTNVNPKHAYRISGISAFASDGDARVLCKPAFDRSPRKGEDVWDW